KDCGAHEIFGIPGDFVLPFFKVIEEIGILPYYTLSHEPAVGFAADVNLAIDGAMDSTQSSCWSTTPVGRCCGPSSPSRASTISMTGTLPRSPPHSGVMASG